jgi:5'-3' exonuclease
MYSLAKEWQDKGGNVIVVTSDKDMGQMITDTALLFDSFKDEMVNTQVFEKRWAFRSVRLLSILLYLGTLLIIFRGLKG